MNSQMKKGILEMCILQEFREKDCYGYDILEKMKVFFPEVNDSTFYAILRRLQASGYTKSYFKSEKNNHQRKYYKITPQGIIYLNECTKSWFDLKRIVEEIGIE